VGRYIQPSDVQAALGTEVYLRAFDKDRDGVADAALVALAIERAEARIDMMLRSSHGTPFTGTIPDAIKHLAVGLAPHEIVRLSPGGGGKDAPYKATWDAAIEDLRMLAKDSGARLPAQVGEPTSSGSSYVSAPTPVWGAAANSAEADPDGESLNGTGGRFNGF
jgi:hypothetical protein